MRTASFIKRRTGRLIHEGVPLSVQRAVSPLTVPLSPFYLRNGGLLFYRYYRMLKKKQWLSREELEEEQSAALRRLTEHCEQNVPYYRRLFRREGISSSNIRCIEDIKRIPVLTKEMVRKNFCSLISRRPCDIHGSVLSRTTGTTGTPMRHIRDRFVSGFNAACNEIWYEMAGFPSLLARAKRREIIAFTDKCGVDSRGLFFGRSPDYDLLSGKLIISQSTNNRELMAYARMIRNNRVRFFVGRPLFLFHFARFLEKEGKGELGLKSAISLGSSLSGTRKKYIEDTIDCRVFNSYKNTEFLSHASECFNGRMHTEPLLSITETLRKGKNVTGKHGSLVSTGLIHRAMPLIRFDMGDIAIISKKRCSCGRESLTIESIEGRSGDAVVLEGGRTIFPMELQPALEKETSIKESQIVQEEGGFLLRLVKDKGFSEQSERRAINELKRVLGSNAKIRVSYESSIFGPGEKPKMVISRAANRF